MAALEGLLLKCIVLISKKPRFNENRHIVWRFCTYVVLLNIQGLACKMVYLWGHGNAFCLFSEATAVTYALTADV